MKRRNPEFELYSANLRKEYKPIIAQINSADHRDNYLKKSDNNYTRFILEKLSKNSQIIDKNPSRLIEIHHIIPLACGGPDVNWNRMELTYSDHNRAHSIRWQVYKE